MGRTIFKIGQQWRKVKGGGLLGLINASPLESWWITLFTFASETRVAFHRRPSRYIFIGDHKLAIKGRHHCNRIS